MNVLNYLQVTVATITLEDGILTDAIIEQSKEFIRAKAAQEGREVDEDTWTIGRQTIRAELKR